MDIYKVSFENNKPVSCIQVTVAHCSELNELRMEGSKPVIKWCIVDAEHEEQAFEVANKSVKKRWAGLLGIRA